MDTITQRAGFIANQQGMRLDRKIRKVHRANSNDLYGGFFVTGFITWLNVGLSDDFVTRWARGWLFGWPIAALAVITLAPFGNTITDFIIRKLF